MTSKQARHVDSKNPRSSILRRNTGRLPSDITLLSAEVSGTLQKSFNLPPTEICHAHVV
jgi:hypothetical protein